MEEDELIVRRMLKALNLQFNTSFYHDQFVEWSNEPLNPEPVEKVFKLKGVYNGIYVAIKL